MEVWSGGIWACGGWNAGNVPQKGLNSEVYHIYAVCFYMSSMLDEASWDEARWRAFIPRRRFGSHGRTFCTFASRVSSHSRESTSKFHGVAF